MADVDLAFRIHQASVELAALTSLMLTLIETADAVGDKVDPAEAGRIAADLARLAADSLASVLARLLEAERIAA